MKTKIKILISILLIANLSQAAIMPLPILLPINSNGGATDKDIIGLWIAMNIILVIFFIIENIKNITFKSVDYYEIFRSLSLVGLIAINGIVAIIALALFISSLL